MLMNFWRKIVFEKEFEGLETASQLWGLRHCINQIKSFSTSLLIGRISILIAAFFHGEAFWALAFAAFFVVINFYQKSVLKKCENELENQDPNLEAIARHVEKDALLRQFFIAIVYGSLLFSNKPNLETLGSFYICAYYFTIIFQYSSVPRVLSKTLGAMYIAGIIMGTSKAIYLQSFYPILFLMLFLVMVYFIANFTVKTTGGIFAMKRELEHQVTIANHRFSQINEEIELRSHLESVAGVGIYKWHFGTNEHFWSDGTYKALGVENSKIKISSNEFKRRIAPEDLENYVREASKAKQTGQPFSLEFSFLGDDNKYRRIYFHSLPMLDADNNNIGMIGIVVDQTELKNSLHKATKAQKILQLALATSSSVVFEKDYSKNRLTAFGSLRSGITHEKKDSEELEKMVRAGMTEAEQKMVENLVFKAEKSGEIQVGEHLFRYPDGKVIDAKVFVYVEGEPSKGNGRMISITTDVSDDIKRRSELSEALETARKASRAKTEFLANMSHEIRTPLNGIIALTSLLSKTNLDDKQTEMLELIESSGDTLLSLLNDILDLARVESGRLEIDNIEFNLAEALRISAALFSSKAEEKGLEFVYNIDEAADEKYLGDPNRIKQIIANLVSNSVKFTKQGKITLDAKVVEATDKKFVWEFVVSDTGIGISHDKIVKLFERFEQADGSITREHGGSGLGLSICKGLCDLMGGEISAFSEPGRGTSIHLRLPLCAVENHFSQENHAIKVSDTNLDNSEIRILAADDNETNRKVLDLILGQMGANIDFTVNGEEAVRAFKSNQYDLILMDLQMPVKDGLTATQEIREFEKSNNKAQIPIIALSANAMKHHIEEALSAGANAHLAKPFTPQGLYDEIAKWLEPNNSIHEEESAA